MEASTASYQRSSAFHSQAKLFAWIDRSSETHLRRVRTLTLRLTDINLSSLFEMPTARHNVKPNSWTLYQQELEALDKALQCLPGLTDLTIFLPEKSFSQLLKGMYMSFLAVIPERLPRLTRLTIHGDTPRILEHVPGLSKITTVTIQDQNAGNSSGSSSSSKNSTSPFQRGEARLPGRVKLERTVVKSEPDSN